MEEKKVADYFVVAGLPNEPELLDSNFISEGQPKTRHGQTPITEIGVIFPTLNEKLPEGWEVINHTPTGLNADLNHGSLRTIESYICFKRGTDKPPLVDIGIMYEGKEYLMSDAEIVRESVGGNVANVNNSTSRIFITYRRGHPTMPCNALVVTDICVVIASKGESPPHAFCCINKNLNKGIVGSDVFLCYKKSMNKAKSITYKPEILSRYPMKDLSDFPFPNSVPLFCLPMGATLEMWPKEASRPKPVFSSFVLTVSDAKFKIYGSAITFYEEYPKDQLTKEQKESLNYEDDSDEILNVNKSICVLSHWPFSDTFMGWLYFLYDVVCGNKPQLVPIESFIVQLIDEVPFPKPRTLLQLSMLHPFDKAIFTQPEDLPLPRSAAKFRELLANLGPENCLQVLLLILTEQKILIHSLRPDTLTSVAEAVSSLLFPFKWQCPYIPLCPLGLVEVLHAPLPFLVGVDSRFFDFHDPPPDVSCVDLDTNIITVAEHQRQLLSVKLLPKRAAKCLKATLEAIYHRLRLHTEVNEQPVDENIETEFLKRKKEQALEFEIMEAFVKFMVLILKGYKSYLLPITKAPTIGTTDTKALFQLTDFLKSRDKSNQKFFSLLVKTQMFSRFIEERSFVDDDQGLSFFDECIELMSEELDVKLIEHDGIVKSDKTNFILPPEPTLTTPIVYKNFTLNPILMKNNKKNHFSAALNYNACLPGSPMARRTNHEIKTAQKLARKCSRSPDLWAKCLCGACHTLYFMMLPSVLALNPTKEKIVLQQAYELLVRATHLRLACDEICYRLVIQLCGEHSRPLLAVKLLVLMRKFGLQPNALTYGLYNRCVLEAEWPAHSSSSQLLWNKLRNVVMGAAHFKWAGKRKSLRNSTTSIDGVASLEPNDRTPSHSSLDSHENIPSESLLEKLGRNIFRGNIYGSFQSVTDNVDATTSEDKESANCRSSNESFVDPEILPDNDDTIKNAQSDNSEDSKCDIETERRIVNSNNFSLSSCLKLTDPLGALDDEEEQFTASCLPNVPSHTQEIRKTSNNNGDLYEPTTVKKSATFENSPTNSKLIRSETVPASTVASSLASLGSSIKIGFSATSLASKKSNELIQGGLSSIKSAATSMVKKLDEIKEAISTSANSTPVKHRNGESSYFTYDDSGNENRVRKISTEFDSIKINCTLMKDIEEKLPSSLHPCPNEKNSGSELDICLTSCSQCHHCMNILYDEEIMAHWMAEDSNLNTICQNCDKPTVPLLTITIMGTNLPVCDPFSVPYLSPLVLRKELENIIFQEGDLCLTEVKFITDHPIIYWNLVWVFERINLQTFLPNLYLKTKIGKRKSENCEELESLDGSYMQPVEAGTDPLSQELVAQEQLSIPVSVTCLWDQPRIHGDKPPMYVFWDHRDFSSSMPKMMTKIFMQNIISYIRLNDLTEPIKLLVAEREKLIEEIACKNKIPYPLYRDILFLACKALGRGQVDLNMFDKEYFSSYTRLTERPENKSISKCVRKQDKPICLNSLYCRQYFKPLTLP